MDTKGLSAATRKWLDELSRLFVLEPHHEHLLLGAARAWDRSEQARALVAKQGMILTSKSGMARPHPAIAVEQASMVLFGKLIGQLKLDGDGRIMPLVPGQQYHDAREDDGAGTSH